MRCSTDFDVATKEPQLSTLEPAIAIDAQAQHAGQADSGGEAYVLHPLRVMLRVRGDKSLRDHFVEQTTLGTTGNLASPGGTQRCQSD